MGAHGLGGGYHVFVAGLNVEVAYVFVDSPREQVRLLQDHAHLIDHRPTLHMPDVMPVHLDRALGNVGEPVDEGNQSAFTRSSGPYQSDILARLNVKVDVL